MDIKKRNKRQTVTITIPNGTASGNAVENNDYKPDRDYRNIIGVWAKVLNEANTDWVDIQLRDGQGNLLIDPSHSELWSGGTGLKPEDMFVPVLVPITGSIVKIGAVPNIAAGGNTNAAIVVQCVFLLSDELIEIVSAK